VRCLAGYYRLLVWPQPLVADRAPPRGEGLGDARAWAALLLLAAIAGFALWARRRAPAAGFGAAWSLAALAPASNVVALYAPMAERYAYQCAAGAAVAAAAWAWPRLERRRLAGLCAAAALCAALGARTYARNADWRSDDALFLSGPDDAPRSSMALHNRGDALRRAGRFAEAERAFEASVERRPDFAQAWLGLAACRAELGRPRQAELAYLKALALAPSDPVGPLVYGLFLERTGRPKQAVERFKRSLALDPGYAEAWLDLGRAYERLGRRADARFAYGKAAGLAPGDPMPLYFLGGLAEAAGERAAAARFFEAALRREPTFAPASVRLGRLKKAAP
jgi:Flp pilus assembly protein TadD